MPKITLCSSSRVIKKENGTIFDDAFTYSQILSIMKSKFYDLIFPVEGSVCGGFIVKIQMVKIDTKMTPEKHNGSQLWFSLWGRELKYL